MKGLMEVTATRFGIDQSGPDGTNLKSKQDERAQYNIHAALASKSLHAILRSRSTFGIDNVIPITLRRLVNAISGRPR